MCILVIDYVLIGRAEQSSVNKTQRFNFEEFISERQTPLTFKLLTKQILRVLLRILLIINEIFLVL